MDEAVNRSDYEQKTAAETGAAAEDELQGVSGGFASNIKPGQQFATFVCSNCGKTYTLPYNAVLGGYTGSCPSCGSSARTGI